VDRATERADRDSDVIALKSVGSPYDHAHNARIDENLYVQRSMTETVNSAVKRSHGGAERARDWYREFRETTLMCVVYNIKR